MSDFYDFAVPGKVLEITGSFAKVDFGGRVIREVNISFVDVEVGKYVLVHGEYAIQVVNEEEAKKTLQHWKNE